MVLLYTLIFKTSCVHFYCIFQLSDTLDLTPCGGTLCSYTCICHYRFYVVIVYVVCAFKGKMHLSYQNECYTVFYFAR